MKLTVLVSFLGFLTVASCAHEGTFTWVDDLPPAAMAPEAYRIQPFDAISVLVWNQPKLSADELKVRSDGQVTLPLLGDVAVVNLTPAGAAQQIEHRLDGLVVDPKVTVALKDSQAASFTVMGEVKAPGSYPLKGMVGVLQGLATAGGFTEFADQDKVYVLRKGATLQRIRFSYEKLSHAQGRGPSFQLRDGDTLVVED